MKVGAATRAKLVEIGETIREARERTGLSQAALAEKIGMHRENMIRVEKGRTNLTVETMMKIADALGLSLQIVLARRRSV